MAAARVPAPAFSEFDYRALAEFRYQIRRFLHFSEEQARLHGLEPRYHQLLLAVQGLPAGAKATVGELASRLFIRHHSAVELIDRLAERRLIRRAPDPTDHRQVIVSLTRSGAAVLNRLSGAHHQELETLGPELAASLRAVMRRRPAKSNTTAAS
jgi:DNA-binding MarR family transcriptional regulator